MTTYSNDEDMQSAEVTVESISLEKMLPEQSWDVEFVEWAYENIPIPGITKTTLANDLVTPVAANLGRIKADADAWRICGNNLLRVASNMEFNARQLCDHHWEGKAADAFRNGIGLAWVAPLAAGGAICRHIAAGLDMVFEGCLEAVKALAESLIPAIVSILERIASKAVPVVGWAWELIESVANWDFPYSDEIETVVGMIETVFHIHETVEKLATLMKKYLAAFEAFKDFVCAIGNLDSTPSGATIVGMGQDLKTMGDAVVAYTGKLDRDDDGNVLRDDDGSLKVEEKSEYDKAVGSLKETTEEIKEKLYGGAENARRKGRH